MARYVVRFGSMRVLGVFSTRFDNMRRGAKVIARTQRGLEIGEILCEATDKAIAQITDPSSGQILREMTHEDQNELNHIRQQERKEFEICRQHVRFMGLQMQLVDIERLFGGERVVIYYLAEQRIDFRELVKVLASEFQTRIEMRQIGVRDEAKLLADYGDCGKPLCCNTYLVDMPPVSMKMAKLQKATLDPTKISGRCGRLKCCLRYEFDTYEELQKNLPTVGADVITSTGRMRVLGQEILAQQLLVQTEDNRRMLIPASDVLTVLKSGQRPNDSAAEQNHIARDFDKNAAPRIRPDSQAPQDHQSNPEPPQSNHQNRGGPGRRDSGREGPGTGGPEAENQE
ncbi:MAG: signal peptidase [Planctomycetes bacterium]|nr:signal peptidase [Planctomycetota bacterium]